MLLYSMYVLSSDYIPVESVMNSCVDVLGVPNALAATVTVYILNTWRLVKIIWVVVVVIGLLSVVEHNCLLLSVNRSREMV